MYSRRMMKVKEESEKVGLKLNIQKKQRSWHPVPSLHGKQMGKQCQTLFWGAPKSLQMVNAAMKLKDVCSLEGLPCGSADKKSAHNVGDLGSIPGLGRSPGEGKGYPLQYSGLENAMGCIVHGISKSRTRLSDFHLHQVDLYLTDYF